MIFTPVYGGGSSGGGTGVGALDFSFDGAMSSVRADDAGNWEFDILSSGTLVFNKDPGLIDVFLVGGGSGGALNNGNGGCGGKTLTARGVFVQKKTQYILEIGAGGEIGAAGGDTIGFSYTAKGGTLAEGGSGGGGSGYTHCGKGGSDGANGVNGGDYRDDGGGVYSEGGKGQGTTTRAFEEPSGRLCSGGGGGSSGMYGSVQGVGGEGGGGDAYKNGTDNLGGGGGGAAAGGCGLMIIRNHRGVAA